MRGGAIPVLVWALAAARPVRGQLDLRGRPDPDRGQRLGSSAVIVLWGLGGALFGRQALRSGPPPPTPPRPRAVPDISFGGCRAPGSRVATMVFGLRLGALPHLLRRRPACPLARSPGGRAALRAGDGARASPAGAERGEPARRASRAARSRRRAAGSSEGRPGDRRRARRSLSLRAADGGEPAAAVDCRGRRRRRRPVRRGRWCGSRTWPAWRGRVLRGRPGARACSSPCSRASTPTTTAALGPHGPAPAAADGRAGAAARRAPLAARAARAAAGAAARGRRGCCARHAAARGSPLGGAARSSRPSCWARTCRRSTTRRSPPARSTTPSTSRTCSAGLLLFAAAARRRPGRRRRLDGLGRLFYVLAAMPPMALVGAYLNRATSVVYRPTRPPARALGVSAVLDQRQAGAIMWVGGGLVMIAVGLRERARRDGRARSAGSQARERRVLASAPAGRSEAMRALARRWRRRRPWHARAWLRVTLAILSGGVAVSLLAAQGSEGAAAVAAGGQSGARRTSGRSPPRPGELIVPTRDLAGAGRRKAARCTPTAARPATASRSQGRRGIAPSLVGVGAGPADFYLSTGRMPLQDPRDAAAARAGPLLTRADRGAGRVRRLLRRPAGARSRTRRRGDLQLGLHAFTLNCAGCHQIVARGGLTVGAAVPVAAGSQNARAGRGGRADGALPDAALRRQADRPVRARLARALRAVDAAIPTTRAAGASTTSARSPRGWSHGSCCWLSLVLFARLIGERTT